MLSKHKPDTAIKFIDASGLFKKETNNNILTDSEDEQNPGHIQQIMSVFESKASVDHLPKWLKWM